MKPAALLAALLLALAAPVQAGPYPWEMWQGARAFRKGDYEAAARRFQAALAARPDSAQAAYDLGLALHRKGDLEGAAERFRAALQTGSYRLKARAAYNLGNALFEQERYQEAVGAYKEALRWDEEDDDARHNLQEALNRLEQQEEPPKQEPPKPKPQDPPEQQPQGSPEQGKEPPEKEPQGGLSPEDAARLLDAFDEKERASDPRLRAKPRLRPPRGGTETW